MDKFEKLIELVNEGEEAKADALFHEIVVDTSRSIYESLMDSEDEIGGDEVDELMNDIAADEQGMSEDDEAMGMDAANDDEYGDEDDERLVAGQFDENVSLTKVTKGIAGKTEGESVGAGNEATNVNTKTINNDNSGAKGAMAKPHQKTGEDNGRSAPEVKPGNSTTEPNESKVKEPKKKGEDAGVNKKSISGS